MKYFALGMSVLYVVVGALLLLSPGFMGQITQFRLPLGIALLVYGVVRAIIWRRKSVQQSEEGE